MFDGIDPTIALQLAETQAIPEYPVPENGGLQYLQAAELDILTSAPSPSGEDIIINGYRYWWYEAGGSGGTGGGGNNSNTNEQEGAQVTSATLPFLYDGPCLI